MRNDGISHGVAHTHIYTLRGKKSNYEDLHNRTQHKLRVNETEHKKKLKMKMMSVRTTKKKYP